MYFPDLRKMLFECEDEILIFDPETLRIWKGDSDARRILAMLEDGKSIPKIAHALSRSESSISEEIEDLKEQGILSEKEDGKRYRGEEKEKRESSNIFSVDVLPHGIFAFPLPSEILRKGASYLAHLSREKGENEAIISIKVESEFNSDQIDAVRDIIDEVSADLHMDLLLSLIVDPQHVEHMLDIRMDHMTIEGENLDFHSLKSLDLDSNMMSVHIEEGSLDNTRTAVSELERIDLKNFELPYRYVDLHVDFLNKLSFETFSQASLSDKLINIIVTILSRAPIRSPHCFAGIRTFFCDSQGRIYPCPQAQDQKSVGTLDNVESNHLSLAPKNGGYYSKDCPTCWTRNLCGGGCFLEPQCLEFQHLTEQVIYAYPNIINQMKERMASLSGTDRLEVIVDILERIRQNYLFSWCKLK